MPDRPAEPGAGRAPNADGAPPSPGALGSGSPPRPPAAAPSDVGDGEAGATVAPVERERVIRGIPLWLVRGYLEDLGAHPSAPPAKERVALAAETWGALLEQVEDFQVGSLRVGQVRLSLTGEEPVLRPVLAALEKRLFRGGG